MNDKVRASINEAFPKHPAVTSYTLSDGLIDDYCPVEKTFKEDWETWDEIEDWQILRSDTFLNFAPPESFAYLVPRFMVFVLDDIDGVLPIECQGSGIPDAVVTYLERQLKINSRNPILSDSQLEVIKDFLDVFYIDVYGFSYR